MARSTPCLPDTRHRQHRPQPRTANPGRSSERRYDTIASGITLIPQGEAIGVSFKVCLQVNLGLKLRRGEALRIIAKILGASGNLAWGDEDIVLLPTCVTPEDLTALLDQLVRHLSDIAFRPLTPRQLRDVLQISNVERLRWTKSGQLVRSGTAVIKRGQLIAVPTYCIQGVEKILAEPGTLRRWRGAGETKCHG